MENQTLGPVGPNPVAEEQFRKGFEQARQGDLDEAILAVEAAIAISQEEPRYHDLLGSLYAKKGMYEMAVAEWKRSIECDPDHAEVFRRIETADRMRVQSQVSGNRWNLVALGGLALLFVISLAAATALYRARSSQSSEIASLMNDLASAKQGTVEQAKYDSLLAEKTKLDSRLQESNAKLVETAKQMEQLKTSTASQAELQREQELRNRIQSELTAAKKQNEEMKSQLDAVGNASGVQDMANKIKLKDTEIESLNKNYKSLNDDRKKLEDELAKSKADLVATRDHLANLEEQAAKMMSATETQKLQAEVQSLKDQPAKAGVKPSPRAPSSSNEKEVLFLLNGALDAVRYAVEGKKEAAAEQLKKIQAKAPQGAAFGETLKALEGEPAKVAAEPAAKAKTKAEPTEAPNKAKAKPEPKAEKTPRPKPQPAPTPEPKKAEGPRVAAEGPATPRAVKRLDSLEETNPKKTAKSPEPSSSGEDRRKQLYETKKRLTEQALGLYRQRKFDEASRLVNQAYQVDPKDPAVNQLREAIHKARAQ
jgi:hypothetical protein